MAFTGHILSFLVGGGVKEGWIEWLWRYCKQYNQKLLHFKYLFFTSFFSIMHITNLWFVEVVSVTYLQETCLGVLPNKIPRGCVALFWKSLPYL